MSAQRQVPGGPYVNEVATAQRQAPGAQFINETVAVGGGFKAAWSRQSNIVLMSQKPGHRS